MNLKDVIKKPIITEKSTQMGALNRYVFEVDRRANKKEVAQALGKYFGVQVKRVWTSQYAQGRKKAIVQLAQGEKLDLFETGD